MNRSSEELTYLFPFLQEPKIYMVTATTFLLGLAPKLFLSVCTCRESRNFTNNIIDLIKTTSGCVYLQVHLPLSRVSSSVCEGRGKDLFESVGNTYIV